MNNMNISQIRDLISRNDTGLWKEIKIIGVFTIMALCLIIGMLLFLAIG